MDQNERLNILVNRFLEDSSRGRDMAPGRSPEEKRTVLRSLMNVRPPRPMDADTLRIQDEYLRERARETGIVTLEDIPTLREQYGTEGPFGEVVSLWQGDITRLALDAVVNAANSGMLGCFQPMHTCIDNCIHTYAGIQLRAECARQMALLREEYGRDYEQPTAVPMLTPGYNLPAKHVIHIVGPIVHGALTSRNEEDLAACYRRVLDLCGEKGIATVAFCGISTGVFRFPPERAAQIAVTTVRDWLNAHEGAMERVVFTVFRRGKDHYEKLLMETQGR